MTWIISAVTTDGSAGILFPIAPNTWEWSHVKQNLTQSSQSSFLSFLSGNTRSQEMKITGYIWPFTLARQLQDLIKDPHDPFVAIETNNAEIQPMVDGDYIINRGNVKLDRPIFSEGTLVYSYEISFMQTPEQNESTTGDQGTPTNDEPATGLDDFFEDGLFEPVNFSEFFLLPDFLKKVFE